MVLPLFMPDLRLPRRAVMAMALALAVSSPPSRAAENGPQTFISGLGERALELLGRPQEAVSRSEITGLLDAAVDLELLARLALGRHWNAASEKQRREYLELFRAYALQGLTSAFATYAGLQRFVVLGSSAAGDGDILVKTDLHLEPGRPPYHVDWRVRQRGDRFVVVDVIAEGVSLLITNREEFNSIIGSSGIDGLLREMRTWHEEGTIVRPSDG
jgi:phospholipid transport system substrate-binding protein